jgi:endopolyphosphatase
MEYLFQMARKYLPGIPLLPTIGNNDVLIHDQAPDGPDQSKILYEYLFKVWFPQWGSTTTQWRDFSSGGYYKYEFPGTNIVFLGLNTMYFSEHNNYGDSTGQ